MAPPEVSSWVESFSSASVLINGEGENRVIGNGFSDGGSPLGTPIEMFIGATNSESFKGSIGLVEIFTPGAVVQTSIYHLIIYFFNSFLKRKCKYKSL